MIQAPVKPMNIIEMALDEGSLGTFVKAIEGSDLEEILASESEFTVFAPRDSAFSDYAQSTVEELLSNKDELNTLLSYHIVPGKYSEADLKDRSSLTTLLGKEIRLSSGAIDNAHIVEPDIECSNGVLHVIDQVLVPK